jgi:hypothetical protein
MRIVFVAVACGLAVAGCAKDANQVGANSASIYQSYTCPQLAEEASFVSSRAAQATGAQEFTGDKIAMNVGLVVFFPLLMFTKGNYEDTAELARLRGSMEAIEQASIQKNCGITFQYVPPPAPPKISTIERRPARQ